MEALEWLNYGVRPHFCARLRRDGPDRLNHGVRPGGSDTYAAAEGGAEQAGDDVDEAGGAALRAHAADRLIEDLVAGAAQAGTDDALRVEGGDAPGLEALGEREHVVVAEGLLHRPARPA